ncbi:alpha/beta fold hydrolase [Streptomyces sp. NPDC004082]|uniref:alpha/beta fold hydrolase n=1 Tax=unclassified Streptomyces TaxID=2593676 RepID=UPI0033B6BF3C
MSRAPRPDPVGESTVLGEDLAVHRFGTPPAAAFVHGLEDAWNSWTPLAGLLAGRLRGYPLDLPWRTGGTYRWRSRGSTAQWVDAGLKLVPEPVSVLVAHSLGANAVLQWLATGVRPGLDALVLLSPFYWPPSQPADWQMFDSFREDFATVMTMGLRTRLGARAQTMDPEIFNGMARKMLEGMGPQAFLALFDQYSAATGLDLAHVDIPTLVIGSPHDTGLAGERADALKADMPAAEFHLDPRLTHFCHSDQPDEVARLVLAFLDRTAGARRTAA